MIKSEHNSSLKAAFDRWRSSTERVAQVEALPDPIFSFFQFVEELQTEGGYEVVDDGAEDVMIIRPAIIDLDIEAPDTMTPGMSATFSASAGQMTLYMELFDSVTSEIIARVVDAEGGRDHGMIRNRATNKAEADRILRKWADILRSHLDRVHGKK